MSKNTKIKIKVFEGIILSVIIVAITVLSVVIGFILATNGQVLLGSILLISMLLLGGVNLYQFIKKMKTQIQEY